MWLALAIEIAGIIHERLALANKRADLATDPAAKKAAVDEGLIIADTGQKLFDKIRGFIDGLKDDKTPPLVGPVPLPASGVGAAASLQERH